MTAQTQESKDKIRQTLRARGLDAHRAQRARELLFMARPILEQQAEAGDPTAGYILARLPEVLTERQLGTESVPIGARTT